MQRRRWGAGTIRQEPNGSWGVRWRENDGRRRYKGGLPSRGLAESLLAKIVFERTRETAGLPPDPAGFPFLDDLFKAWIERRKVTHASWRDDQSRWKLHLSPRVGRLRPADVTHAVIREVVEDRLTAGLARQTVQHLVRLLSTLFTDLCERPAATGVTVNPVRTLPRSTRRLARPDHHPELVPYLRTMKDVARVYDALPDPARAAFAIGAFAGLRTGETLGLEWKHVDLARRRLEIVQRVRWSKLGPPKDGARVVPIVDALLPELRRWKLATGGDGFLFKAAQPGRRAGKNGTRSQFMRPNSLHEALEPVVKKAKLGPLTWYQATRHTFASQFLIAGGSVERLAVMLGHSTTEVTRRYAHLGAEHITDEDRARLGRTISDNKRGMGSGKVVGRIGGKRKRAK